MKSAIPLNTSVNRFSIVSNRLPIADWLIFPQHLYFKMKYIISMDIQLRPPTVNLFRYIATLAEREKFPIRLAISDEHSFIFFIPYQMLADLVFSSIKEKHPEVKIEAVKNKIVFYVNEENKHIIHEDVENIARNIYAKFRVKIGIDIPSDNELLIIARAEPFAVFIAEMTLKEVKKRNSDIIRLFKFLKGELDVPNYGWSLVVGVKYLNSAYDKLEEMVK